MAIFPVKPLAPQKIPVMYASFLASWNTPSTRLENCSASAGWELYAVTVLNALSFSSAVCGVNRVFPTVDEFGRSYF